MQPDQQLYAQLTTLALSHGATAAVVLPAQAVVVDERFAAMCATPHRCPSYGLAPGCPPHAPSPSALRAQLKTYQHLLVFKIDAPVADLIGPPRITIARTIHRIAAEVERAARIHGMSRARGMAAGSCKELFCSEDMDCRVLNSDQPCCFPDLARPSISAVGIDFSALAAHAGWPFGKIGSPTSSTGTPTMGLMAGLVLLA